MLAFDLGDTVKLRVARDSEVTVDAPDGMRLVIAAPQGHFTLWLAQPGVWVYSWTGEPAGSEQIAVSEPVLELIEVEPLPAHGSPLRTSKT